MELEHNVYIRQGHQMLKCERSLKNLNYSSIRVKHDSGLKCSAAHIGKKGKTS